MVLESKYNLQDEVTIKAIQMKGRIDQISWSHLAIEYRVIYWNDSQRNSVWMYEWEIE
jgi:hypothetical protein